MMCTVIWKLPPVLNNGELDKNIKLQILKNKARSLSSYEKKGVYSALVESVLEELLRLWVLNY